MAESRISFEILSAYVDGELPAEKAAEVSLEAANDPALAARIAALQALRAGVAGITEGTGSQPDWTLLTQRATTRLRKNRLMLTAASLFALMLAVTAGVSWFNNRTGTSANPLVAVEKVEDVGLATMIAAHDGWRPGSLDAVEIKGNTDPRFTSLLEASGLTLAYAARLPLPDGKEAHQASYLGQHGCRLSLFAKPIDRSDISLSISVQEKLMLATWTSDEQSFVLVARDMDSVRFSVIASSLEAAARRPAGNDSDLYAMLSGAHQRCLA